MVALKGIPKVLSPELLFALARMGHGDEIGEHEKLVARPSDRGAILVGALNWQRSGKAVDTAAIILPFGAGSYSAA